MLALVVANFKSQRPAEMVRVYHECKKNILFYYFHFCWFCSFLWNVNVVICKVLTWKTSTIKIKTFKFYFVYFQVEPYQSSITYETSMYDLCLVNCSKEL